MPWQYFHLWHYFLWTLTFFSISEGSAWCVAVTKCFVYFFLICAWFHMTKCLPIVSITTCMHILTHNIMRIMYTMRKLILTSSSKSPAQYCCWCFSHTHHVTSCSLLSIQMFSPAKICSWNPRHAAAYKNTAGLIEIYVTPWSAEANFVGCSPCHFHISKSALP